MKTITLKLLNKPCFDCPFLRQNHIKVGKIRRLINFILKPKNINVCHNEKSDNTLCEGGKLFKENLISPNKHPSIFNGKIEAWLSHRKSKAKKGLVIFEEY